MDKKDLKIEFAPGVLEQMEADLTPEELQDFMNMLKAKIEDGSFFEEATEVDMEMLEEADPDTFNKIVDAIDGVDTPRTLH